MAILFEHDFCPIALGFFLRLAGLLSDPLFFQYVATFLKTFAESISKRRLMCLVTLRIMLGALKFAISSIMAIYNPT